MSDKPRMMAPMAMPRTPKRTMERLTLMATMTTNKKLDAAALCREPKALLADSRWGFPNRGGMLIQVGAGGFAPCHQRSDCERTIRRRSFGRAGPAVEGRQPEPTASVAGCGSGRNGSRIGGEDRRHGSPDACATGFIASTPRVRRGLSTTGRKVPSLACRTEQLAQFAQIVEAGPDREKDGVVRWRRIDLKRVIAERFGVDFHARYVGKLLKKLGFSHISARPRHPAQDERIVEAFKKTSRAR